MAVRRESVRLELEDAGFTTGMARAAAQTAHLKRELKDLSGTAVRSRKDLTPVEKDVDKLGKSSKRSGDDINKLTGRLRLFADAALVLGPALIPLGAGAIPALSATAMGLTVTAAAAGTMLLALNGLGDGLKALNTYQLEKTPENLQALRIEMEKLGPDGARFVQFLDSLEPKLRDLQMVARAGMLPGWEEGIETLMTQLPGLRDLAQDMSLTLGNLGKDAGESLAGEDFEDFFDYLATDASPTLDEMARSVGNFAHGFANLVVGLAPATRDFSGGLLELSQRFADWSDGLEDNRSFQDFLDYVRESGPQALDLLGTMATTFASIVEDAAPVGAVVLPAVTALVDIIGELADSPLGPFLFTAVAGYAAYSRAAAIATAASARFSAAQATGFKGAKVALGIGAVVLAVKGLSDAYQKGEEYASRLNDTLADGTFNMRSARDEIEAFQDDLDTDSPSEFIKNMLDPDVWADFTDHAFGAKSETDEMTEALQRAEEHAAAAPGVMGLLGAALGATADEFEDAANGAQLFSGRLSELNGWLDKRQALRDYRQSIRDLAAGFKDGFGKKDIENVDAVGRSILQVAKNLKNPGRQADFLANSRAALIELRKKSGPEARAEIQLLINKMDELGLTHPKPKVDVDDKPARDKINGVQKAGDKWAQFFGKGHLDADDGKAVGKLSDLKRKGHDWDTFYGKSALDADTSAALSKIAALDRAAARPITKTVNIFAHKVGKALEGMEFASGGYTGPGHRLEPRGIVHAGEVVIPQHLVRRDWSMLRSRYGTLPGFADGGVVPAVRAQDGPRSGLQAEVIGVIGSLRDLRRELKESEKAVAREKKQRDAVTDKMTDLSGNVSGGLRSDIFETPANVFGQPSDPNSILRGDIREGRELGRLIEQLKGKGLDGGALAELLSKNDINLVRAYARMPAKALREYERLYDRREHVLHQTGQAAGNAAYGADLAVANKELAHANKRLAAIERAVKAADKANQKGHHDGSKRVAASVTGAGARGNRNKRYAS